MPASGRSRWLPILVLGFGPGFGLGFSASGLAAEPTLESKLKPLIDAHKGNVAVVARHLRTGETYTFQADTVFPTASVIKFPVMVEAYRQAEAGQLDLGKMITLKAEDKVPGSGILTNHFSDGMTLSVRDAVRLMIRYSDNTATNLVLDQIGIPSTAETMQKLGYPNTRINSKVFRASSSPFPEQSKKYGLGSTTAAEMARMLEALHRRELVSPKASEAMLEHLRTCDDHDKFPRFLPEGLKIAFKTGSLTDLKSAVGIIEDPVAGPFILCVLTDENGDHRWVTDNAGNRLCAELAREAFDHFRTRAAAAGARESGPPAP